jgi:hypothetical protein
MGKNLVLCWNSRYYSVDNIIMWAMTRVPNNPITSRGGPISEMAIAIEVFQIAYVVITAIIIEREIEKYRQSNRKSLINDDK